MTNSGKSGGNTISFSGAITDTGGGINLDNNDQNGGVTTVNFTGALNIDSTVNTGFNATNGGTVNATNAANSINTTTGTALNVANTTIGASNLIFHDISANGAVNGIVLNTTGIERSPRGDWRRQRCAGRRLLRRHNSEHDRRRHFADQHDRCHPSTI